jgi:hypothetical protein
MMTDLLSAYQRDLNASLKKLTTDLAQVLVAAARAVEEFNAATAARGVAFEAEMEERMRHFREGPRDGVASVEFRPGRIAPSIVQFMTRMATKAEVAEFEARYPIDPVAIEKFEEMPNVYESTGAP